MNRMNKDEYYLKIASTVAERSTCLKRKYGAVIVNNDEIVSTGYNGAPRGEENCCDRGNCPRLNKPSNISSYEDCCSVHAEMNAIIQASRKDMIGSTLYLFGWQVTNRENNSSERIDNPCPCYMCKRIIKNAGIKKVITKDGVIDF